MNIKTKERKTVIESHDRSDGFEKSSIGVYFSIVGRIGDHWKEIAYRHNCREVIQSWYFKCVLAEKYPEEYHHGFVMPDTLLPTNELNITVYHNYCSLKYNLSLLNTFEVSVGYKPTTLIRAVVLGEEDLQNNFKVYILETDPLWFTSCVSLSLYLLIVRFLCVKKRNTSLLLKDVIFSSREDKMLLEAFVGTDIPLLLKNIKEVFKGDYRIKARLSKPLPLERECFDLFKDGITSFIYQLPLSKPNDERVSIFKTMLERQCL